MIYVPIIIVCGIVLRASAGIPGTSHRRVAVRALTVSVAGVAGLRCGRVSISASVGRRCVRVLMFHLWSMRVRIAIATVVGHWLGWSTVRRNRSRRTVMRWHSLRWQCACWRASVVPSTLRSRGASHSRDTTALVDRRYGGRVRWLA